MRVSSLWPPKLRPRLSLSARSLGFPKKRFRDQLRSNGPFFGLLTKSSLTVFLKAQTTISNSIALVLTGLKELGAPETPQIRQPADFIPTGKDMFWLVNGWRMEVIIFGGQKSMKLTFFRMRKDKSKENRSNA